MKFLRNFKLTGLHTCGTFKNYVDQIKVGTQVYLQRDSSNRYDGRATGVFYKGDRIAWIPKALNGVEISPYGDSISEMLNKGIRR